MACRDSRKFTLKGALRHFGDHTSMKGVKRALYAPNLAWKLVWMGVVSCGLTMAFYQVSLLMKDYLDFPRAQQEDTMYSEVPFPAITVCNLQPLSSDTGPNHTDNARMIDQYYEFVKPLRTNATPDEQKKLVKLLSPWGFYQNTDNVVDIKKRGHQHDDLVMYCSWDSSMPRSTKNYQPCKTIKDLTSPDFFNCYTYGSKKPIMIQPGHYGGLTLILYLDDFQNTRLETQQEFNPDIYIANSHGARVMLHKPHTMPHHMKDGFDVSPGLSVTYNVRVTKYTRLGYPYSNCTKQEKLVVRNAVDAKYEDQTYTYSATTCADLCLQRYIQINCKCADASLPLLSADEMPPGEIKFCGRLSEDEQQRREVFKDIACAEEAREQSENCSHQCPSPCQEHQYSVSMSQSRWPHEAAHLSLFKEHIKNKRYAKQFNDTYAPIIPQMAKTPYQAFQSLRSSDLISRNFLRIIVHLENEGFKEIIETSVFDSSNLMANIGGMFNLWIGITFITLFEIGELFYDLVMVMFSSERDGPTRSPRDSRDFKEGTSPDKEDKDFDQDVNHCSLPLQPHTSGMQV